MRDTPKTAIFHAQNLKIRNFRAQNRKLLRDPIWTSSYMRATFCQRIDFFIGKNAVLELKIEFMFKNSTFSIKNSIR